MPKIFASQPYQPIAKQDAQPSRTVLQTIVKGLSNISTPEHPPGAIPLGEHFYLFQGTSNASDRKLIITAEGNSLPTTPFTVPENTSLKFYCPDQQVLDNPNLSSLSENLIVAPETQVAGTPGHDYRLEKYSENDYKQILNIAKKSEFDILTVRNRKGFFTKAKNNFLTLSDALKSVTNAQLEHSYSEIHCSFSRHLLSDPDPIHYSPTPKLDKLVDQARKSPLTMPTESHPA